MGGDAELILLTIAGVHLLGLCCVAVLMFTALREGPGEPPWANPDSDDGRGNKPLRPRRPSDRPRGGIPLPDAEPARVRLRDHRKLGETLPGRERRPAREPARRPVRTH